MISQHGSLLAAGIITAHFGELVGQVCECLIRRGTLSLMEIARFTELPPKRVKSPLLVLIQHNCVQAFSATTASRGVAKSSTQYMVVFDNIIHRLSFAKFLAIAKAALGDKCESLLEGLLQHGRLTFEQLTARQNSTGQYEGTDMIADFNKLVRAQYVERCPMAEPDMAKLLENEPLPSKKRDTKLKILAIEQKALMAAALTDGERFCVLDCKAKGDDSEVSVGDKRKREILELDVETQAAIDKSEVLWRANAEKFVYCLKKKACVANVRSRLGPYAGDIFEAMVDSDTDNYLKSKNFVTSDIDKIIETARNHGISPVSIDNVRPVLEQIGCCADFKAKGSITLDLKSIIDKYHQEETETLVMQRYGQAAYRIFRLLNANGSLQETDQISSVTFVDKKETNEILCKLWRDGYLDMKKVTVTAPRKMDLCLWRANQSEVHRHVLDFMYHAAFNLLQKIDHVRLKELEEGFFKDDRAHQKKVNLMLIVLHSSLLKLGDSILLFRDPMSSS